VSYTIVVKLYSFSQKWVTVQRASGRQHDRTSFCAGASLVNWPKTIKHG